MRESTHRGKKNEGNKREYQYSYLCLLIKNILRVRLIMILGNVFNIFNT